MAPHAANCTPGRLRGRRSTAFRFGWGQCPRFDASPMWFGALGAGLTLPWLASLDARGSGALRRAGQPAAGRTGSAPDSAIVSLPIADAAEKLPRAGIRASVRAGAMRVGFHLYNTDDDLDRLLDALR